MGLDLLLLFVILLAKAQKGASPLAAANDSQAKANQAKAEAQQAAAKGDVPTATAKAAEAQQHQQAANTAAKAARTPPPWPQVVPAGLAPFPGPGWKPASPVTGAMSARAWQLLPQLWEHGEGTWKTEKTADRWVTYRATAMPGGKKGVVAYTTTAAPAAASPLDNEPQALVPARPPQPQAPGQQSAITVPASHTAAPASPASSMPLLKLTSPRMTGPSVVWLQQKLGVGVDGTYGTGTEAAVRRFQAAHGLTVDGKVGHDTWIALGVGSGQRAA